MLEHNNSYGRRAAVVAQVSAVTGCGAEMIDREINALRRAKRSLPKSG